MADAETEIEKTLRKIGETETLLRVRRDYFAWLRGAGDKPTRADEMGLAACEATLTKHRRRLATLLGI